MDLPSESNLNTNQVIQDYDDSVPYDDWSHYVARGYSYKVAERKSGSKYRATRSKHIRAAVRDEIYLEKQ